MKPPIRNRAKFFEHVQQGLQAYFDRHDRKFHGMLYFAVGVKCGQVRAIIRRDGPMPFAPKTRVGDGLYVNETQPSTAKTNKK